MGANPHACSPSKVAVYTLRGKIAGMGFKKPFRALPVQLGPYQKARQRRRRRTATMKVLGAAAVGGLVVGTLGAMNESGGAASIASSGRGIAASLGLARKNTPMPGAHYPGCDDARAAGVAPLYFGEPGYRTEMDGDGDGVACEPYRS